MNNLLQEQLSKEDFINDILSYNDRIGVYMIGGCVRDFFLNKEIKDIDLLVTHIKIDNLIDLLKKYGKCDLIGESFSVIKFKCNGIEYDIATPRTERKVGEGHKGFEIVSNENITLEEDILRRDFSINTIAINIKNGDIVDICNGLEDLKNTTIRVLGEKSFVDDPLRMLRAVGFASRFNFIIEEKTMVLMQQNAQHIKEISPERILIELEKILSKGNCLIGAYFLKHTGLYSYIFEGTLEILPAAFKKIKSFAEFIFLLNNRRSDSSKFFLKNLKGDTITAKEIEGLSMVSYYDVNVSKGDNCMKVFNALQKSQNIIDTKICVVGMAQILSEFASGKYPKSRKELAINGNDIEALGYSGVVIGEKLNTVLYKVLNDKIGNNKEEIINILNLEKC